MWICVGNLFLSISIGGLSLPYCWKTPLHTGALGATLGWVPHTQCFKTGWQLWAEVPCRKPTSFPAKQNELFVNFLVLVTFSKSSVCYWLPSASSPVVSSTVDEASLGFSHGHFAAVMSLDNFLAPPSAGKSWIIWESKSQPQNHDVLCWICGGLSL